MDPRAGSGSGAGGAPARAPFTRSYGPTGSVSGLRSDPSGVSSYLRFLDTSSDRAATGRDPRPLTAKEQARIEAAAETARLQALRDAPPKSPMALLMEAGQSFFSISQTSPDLCRHGRWKAVGGIDHLQPGAGGLQGIEPHQRRCGKRRVSVAQAAVAGADSVGSSLDWGTDVLSTAVVAGRLGSGAQAEVQRTAPAAAVQPQQQLARSGLAAAAPSLAKQHPKPQQPHWAIPVAAQTTTTTTTTSRPRRDSVDAAVQC